jgi:four helix bundle protein
LVPSKGDDIQERLVQFAARVIRLVNSLPRTLAGRHVAGQLLRSGTAPAAHHAEARSAESATDFIHKLKIAEKELNESEVWLRITIAGELLPANKLADLLDECNQLQRIINASIATARHKRIANSGR